MSAQAQSSPTNRRPKMRFGQAAFAGMMNPYTRQPVPGPPEDKRVLYAELIYPFRSKPHSLTIIPPLDQDGKFSKVSIGFMTYHKRAPLHDFKYLSEPSILTLDWADPWYSQFEKKALHLSCVSHNEFLKTRTRGLWASKLS